MEILWEAKSVLMHESQIEGGLSVPHVAGRLSEIVVSVMHHSAW